MRDDCPVCQMKLSEGRPGFDPRYGESVNAVGISLPVTFCNKSAVQRVTWALPLGISRNVALLLTAVQVDNR